MPTCTLNVYNEEIYYQYTEFILKNNQHRFKDTNISNKQVQSYAFPGNSRCLVKLLDCYLSKLLPNSLYLHMCPLPTFPGDLNRPCCKANNGLALIVLNNFYLGSVMPTD